MKAIEMVTDVLGHTCEAGDYYFADNFTDEALGLKPDKRYAIVAHELPEGCRLATEADRAGRLPDGYRYIEDHPRWEHGAFPGTAYGKGTIYAIPIATPQQKKRATALEAVKAAEAKLAEARKQLEVL